MCAFPICELSPQVKFLAVEEAEDIVGLDFYKDCQFAFPKVASIMSLLINSVLD